MPGLKASPEQLCSVLLQGQDFPFQNFLKHKWYLRLSMGCQWPWMNVVHSTAPHQGKNAATCSGLWHRPTTVQALHFQPLPSLFQCKLSTEGFVYNSNIYYLIFTYSFLPHLVRQQGGCTAADTLELYFCEGKGEKCIDGMVNYFFVFKVVVLSSILTYHLQHAYLSFFSRLTMLLSFISQVLPGPQVHGALCFVRHHCLPSPWAQPAQVED